MSPQKFQQSTDVDLKVDDNINSNIFDQLIKVQQLIKNSQISTWCDHIPEWQMFVTNLLQYLFAAENVFINTANIKYLEETLQYYDKIKDYFNNDEIQEQLLVLFESIKQEIKFKENFNLKYNEHNKLFNPHLCSLVYPEKTMFYDNNIKINSPVNSVLFKYRFNMQTMVLNKKISNIVDLGIINQLLNKFGLKTMFK